MDEDVSWFTGCLVCNVCVCVYLGGSSQVSFCMTKCTYATYNMFLCLQWHMKLFNVTAEFVGDSAVM